MTYKKRRVSVAYMTNSFLATFQTLFQKSSTFMIVEKEMKIVKVKKCILPFISEAHLNCFFNIFLFLLINSFNLF